MAIKTPGSLGILQYTKETTYGTTPEPATMLALGFMNTATADQARESENMGADGTRVTSRAIDGMRTATLSADLTLFATQTGYTWSDILPLTMGNDLKGVDDVPSASYLVKVAKDEYFMLKGGMFDKLTITADKVGAKIVGKVDIKGQILSEPKTKPSDFGTITEASVTNTPIIYNHYAKLYHGTETTIIPSHKFTYTISNSLTAQPGIVDNIAYGAGNGLIPGLLEITLEYEVTSVDDFWDKKKITPFTDTLTIEHYIGGKTVTFKNCELEAGMPSRSQQVYNETLTFKCHGGIEVV